MSSRAFLFPGQGSQFVGMGKELYDTNETAKKIFDLANEIMNINLSKICFEGPEEQLKQTQITQPAIFVHSIAIFQLLKEKNFIPTAAAGHSLGEYSALVASESLTFVDGLNLVKIRGELMQEAGIKNPGTMAAIIGLDSSLVEKTCNTVKDSGIVCPANFNSPEQVVISGDVNAVRACMNAAKEQGAKRAIELVVSGAFHSPLMEHAQQGLAEALEETEIKDATYPIYTNVLAKPTTNKDEIRQLLYKQLTHPVRWLEIIQTMSSDGFSEFYEIGPGKVLSGLNRRIDNKGICTAIGDKTAIDAVV